MNRLTEHHVIESGAYMACSGPCDKDEDACGACLEHEKIVDRLAAYEDSGLEPEQCAKYAQAEKEGRLVVLPRNVDDVVYIVDRLGVLNGENQLLLSFTSEDAEKALEVANNDHRID